MFMLAYHTFLRASEVVRMSRGDISIAQEWIERGASREGRVQLAVMRVHVNRLCKNDRERKGHERIVIGKDAMERAAGMSCVVEMMAAYKFASSSASTSAGDPLFPRVGGGAMSASTPGGRLRFWLGRTEGISNMEHYGFHSLQQEEPQRLQRRAWTNGSSSCTATGAQTQCACTSDPASKREREQVTRWDPTPVAASLSVITADRSVSLLAHTDASLDFEPYRSALCTQSQSN